MTESRMTTTLKSYERLLKNYEWLVANRTGVHVHWETGTVMWGGGGVHLAVLAEKGFTPATRED
jgi:hypothetical protein